MERPTTRVPGALGLAALAMLAALGCGSSDKFTDYVGTWHYTQVDAPLNCDTAGTFSVPTVADKVFAEGIKTSVVDKSVSSIDGITNCDFGFNVSGTNATMPANQACVLNVGSATELPTQWRFTLLGPNQAEEVGSALVHDLPVPNSSGATVTVDCDLTFQATLTRVATD